MINYTWIAETKEKVKELKNTPVSQLRKTATVLQMRSDLKMVLSFLDETYAESNVWVKSTKKWEESVSELPVIHLRKTDNALRLRFSLIVALDFFN
ncbi:hypothetical protein [Geminocystis sp. NIES-3709]|uniref:hypothetical protein n=1 Tax=Geminocystis sp. NIES-3709 TaxID=1617448 RepID=UPI0005FC8DD1|nr:hypothetical protein [Geminocystis sp. NIES-3709]BAQ65546.1 hypothetical protein GM3709_2311 [Geminocystis sp. NIES-3709]